MPIDFEIMTNNNAGTLTLQGSPRLRGPPGMPTTNNVYVVGVRAVDPGGRESAARTFNVRVTNVEEPGAVIVSHNGDEPWYGGLQPRVGVELLAYATDPDHIKDDVNDTSDDVTWQWYRGNESSAVCSDTVSDNCLIDGADESAYTPVVGDVGKHLTAAASYFDRENTASRKAAASRSMYVTQADSGANKPPTFEQDETSLTEGTGVTSYGSDINTLFDLTPFAADVETFDALVQLGDKRGRQRRRHGRPRPHRRHRPRRGRRADLLHRGRRSRNERADEIDHSDSFAIDRATGQITLKKKVDREAARPPVRC